MHPYRVEPGSNADLSNRDPGDTSQWTGDEDEAKAETLTLVARIEKLQELLYAEGKHRVLVVFQATDTGGKDGVIRKVFDGVNPTGVKVTSFKKPTEPELEHDFLWRVHAHVPGNGELVIFNRSHYEDVLVVRVHKLVPKQQWQRRYEHIRNFEELLVDEGTIILKFFLHISKDEQAERLQARLDNPDKRWKFQAADLDERKQWDDYQRAFEDALTKTSTDTAPWYVIPANRKWYRDLVVARVVVDRLESLDMQYPDPPDLDGVTVT